MEEVTALIAKSQAGDKEAREILIEKNLGLVHHIVKRFLGRGYEAEDLFQIGSIGLIKAIDKFDLSFDVKFSTYAVPMISGEIKRFLRDDGMVKVSRTLKENGWKVKQAAERIIREQGREATLEEIAALTELTVEDIVMAMEANVEVESIYKSVYQSEGNEIYLVDKLPEKKDANEKLLNHMLLEQLMGELKEEERKLIILRYFQDKTQVEVAKRLGISQVQVSRMEKRILVRMRESLI
ncbi:SigF/SigG family RNA polymerase sporulation sigma factor [Kineothrix sp. MB12-C1]|uniref:SigF/SigG family RNA polymerase sporulation sigma factor n=1 Tax=Kineothrix sp. MB12-C1 TaxID=3070215 RepID=UPI0027D2109E|nr:SigF/SigG family RNA polymerase sporulation sigma factor [Kineothrix sp. MB12-C1]WMC91954.1 SigF/SigG family RNA polymerase sporulation sigma factor [Kineothrix sp. MB12-C1]